MSSKPILRMPNLPPPPPLPSVSKVKSAFSDVIAAYPPPWCVGPYGDVWVAVDVEQVDPAQTTTVELVDGKWRSTCAKPRRVCEPTDAGIAEMIVDTVNGLYC